MRSPSALHRLLICALAAWMSLCCCEKRLLASFLSDEFAGGTPGRHTIACCQDDCCAAAEGAGHARACDGGDTGDHGTSHDGNHDGNHCGDGCCSKAALMVAAPQFDVDSIGALLPGFVQSGALVDTHGVIPPLFHRSDGEPPPRLTLLISARLRI